MTTARPLLKHVSRAALPANRRWALTADVRRVKRNARTCTRASMGLAWEDKYGKSLEFGVSAAQGLRDEMEDVAAVVPKGSNGFFFAGNALRTMDTRDISLFYRLEICRYVRLEFHIGESACCHDQVCSMGTRERACLSTWLNISTGTFRTFWSP